MVTPKNGTDAEFDEAVAKCASITQNLEKYKKEQQGLLRVSNLLYKDMGKEPFQLEVPVATKVPEEYVLMSKTKSVSRYWTPTIRSLVKNWQEWEERRQAAERSFFSRLLERFDALSIPYWRPASEAAATLDALCGLARASLAMSEPKCKPIVSQGGLFILLTID